MVAALPDPAGTILWFGGVTLTAVPVLGRFGARADNPTRLNRHYVGGWVAFTVLITAATAASARLHRRLVAQRSTWACSPSSIPCQFWLNCAACSSLSQPSWVSVRWVPSPEGVSVYTSVW